MALKKPCNTVCVNTLDCTIQKSAPRIKKTKNKTTVVTILNSQTALNMFALCCGCLLTGSENVTKSKYLIQLKNDTFMSTKKRHTGTKQNKQLVLVDLLIKYLDVQNETEKFSV